MYCIVLYYDYFCVTYSIKKKIQCIHCIVCRIELTIDCIEKRIGWKFNTKILLYCIVLYRIYLDCILYCIVLYCIVLYCIVLYCIVLYCIVLYCIVHVQSSPESLAYLIPLYIGCSVRQILCLPGIARCISKPMRIMVITELSKARRQYFTFATSASRF